MPVDLSDITDQPPARDFRRANGAPMVVRPDGSGKWDRYSRPSGWGSDLDDASALVLWRIDRAMDGVAASPALAASVAAARGTKEGRGELRDRAIQLGRGEEAADLGTALHAMTARVEAGDDFTAPPPYDADIAAYLSTIDAAGLVSRYIEVHICSDRWRAAGTADRIYEVTRQLVAPDGSVIEPGTFLIGDLKTGRSLDYSLPGFAIQLAIYCDGVFYDVETNERSEMPDTLHTGFGVLVHLPVGTGECELLWTDFEVGRIGAETVQHVRRWRKRQDFSDAFVMPTSDEVAILSEAGGMTTSDVTSVPDDPAWADAMAQWCQERINFIGTIPEARALLLRRWPDGVAPLREGIYSASDVAEVLDLIAAIEAAFSLPFPAGDPREEWNRGLYSGDGVQGHQPPSTQEQLNP